MHLPAYRSDVAVQMPLTANSTDDGLVKLTLTPGVSVPRTPAALRAIVFAMRAPTTCWSGLRIGNRRVAKDRPLSPSRGSARAYKPLDRRTTGGRLSGRDSTRGLESEYPPLRSIQLDRPTARNVSTSSEITNLGRPMLSPRSS